MTESLNTMVTNYMPRDSFGQPIPVLPLVASFHITATAAGTDRVLVGAKKVVTITTSEDVYFWVGGATVTVAVGSGSRCLLKAGGQFTFYMGDNTYVGAIRAGQVDAKVDIVVQAQ